MNLLYVTLNPREQLGGLILLALFLLPLPFLAGSLGFVLFSLILFFLSVWVFRRFLRESFQVPLVTPGQIFLKAVLATVAIQLSALLTNDLIFYFLPNYFLYTDVGPMFYMAVWESAVPLVQQNMLLSALCLVVLLPVIEELLFRGFLFGTLYRHSPPVGFALTLVLYTLIRLLPVLGRDTPYLCICALQYIPMTIYLSWIYVRSETIAAPVLAHMLINAVNLHTLRTYYA